MNRKILYIVLLIILTNVLKILKRNIQYFVVLHKFNSNRNIEKQYHKAM